MRDVDDFLREYYISSGSPRVGTNYRLEDTFELSRRVGSPHERLRVVHVAGTSGKTSTAYYCAALIKEAGVTVGLTVSPHISSVAERAQINGTVMDEREYTEYFREYIAIALKNSGQKPSFFELMMVFGLWVFERKGVDYAVVETGMGGLYDSSNICRREDKVSVITDIGRDHVHVLGGTISEIAAHKAGIVAEQNLVCMYEQSEEVMAPVQKAVTHHSADLRIASDTLSSTYMARNFGLALFVYEQVANRDGLKKLSVEAIDRAKNTAVPGRMERIQVHGTTYLLDGAHNEQKTRTLFSTLDSLYPDRKWTVVLALKHNKDITGAVSLIAAHADSIVVSEYEKSQDMPVAAMPADVLADLFTGKGLDVRAEPDLRKALVLAAGRDSEVLLTGSLYAVAEARAWLLGQKQGIVET